MVSANQMFRENPNAKTVSSVPVVPVIKMMRFPNLSERIPQAKEERN